MAGCGAAEGAFGPAGSGPGGFRNTGGGAELAAGVRKPAADPSGCQRPVSASGSPRRPKMSPCWRARPAEALPGGVTAAFPAGHRHDGEPVQVGRAGGPQVTGYRGQLRVRTARVGAEPDHRGRGCSRRYHLAGSGGGGRDPEDSGEHGGETAQGDALGLETVLRRRTYSPAPPKLRFSGRCQRLADRDARQVRS